jgi:hypothetical protein
VLAAQLCWLQARLAFLQHANNLFFGESLLHDRSLSERTLHRQRTNRGEQVSLSKKTRVAARHGSEQTDHQWKRSMKEVCCGQRSDLTNGRQKQLEICLLSGQPLSLEGQKIPAILSFVAKRQPGFPKHQDFAAQNQTS